MGPWWPRRTLPDTAEVSVFGRRRSFATLAAFGLLIGGVVLAAPASAAAPPAPASVSFGSVGNGYVAGQWTASEGAGGYRVWTQIGSENPVEAGTSSDRTSPNPTF